MTDHTWSVPMSQDLDITVHPLLQALLNELPPPGRAWSVERRDAWVRAACDILDLLYPPVPER